MAVFTASTRMKLRRVILTACALLAVAQALWAVRALQIDPRLRDQISLQMPFEFLMGIAWAAAFGAVAWRVARRQPFALRFAPLVLGGFAIYSAIRLLIWAQADYDRHRLSFLWIALALIMPLIVVLRRQKPTVVESE